MSVNRLISETKQSAKQCLSQTPTAILAVNIIKVYVMEAQCYTRCLVREEVMVWLKGLMSQNPSGCQTHYQTHQGQQKQTAFVAYCRM